MITLNYHETEIDYSLYLEGPVVFQSRPRAYDPPSRRKRLTTPNPNTIGLLSLPTEMLIEIAIHVATPQTYNNLTLVNKRLKAILDLGYTRRQFTKQWFATHAGNAHNGSNLIPYICRFTKLHCNAKTCTHRVRETPLGLKPSNTFITDELDQAVFFSSKHYWNRSVVPKRPYAQLARMASGFGHFWIKRLLKKLRESSVAEHNRSGKTFSLETVPLDFEDVVLGCAIYEHWVGAGKPEGYFDAWTYVKVFWDCHCGRQTPSNAFA
ncbi:hypothetical protein BJ508DRAFT_334704 [Ascobolus immersus RN42]|uniref:F-box domain-containing protein n=1 Tax=Ascobolus immersus RN42 TaxID=1160509 RepID=A0A3N4HLT1_ASCIM|nr:hypothetical protein BJ508DRAFT_334704 [Ascobolus immersus RN42]